MATLTIAASNPDGGGIDSTKSAMTSAPHDVAPLCRVPIDVLLGKEKTTGKNNEIITTIDVAIVTGDDELSADKQKICVPTAIVTLRIVFVPSPSDLRDALCDNLGEATASKNNAIEDLRSAASDLSRLRASSGAGSSSKGGLNMSSNMDDGDDIDDLEDKNLVKAGFLNKKKKGVSRKIRPPNVFKRVYRRTIGPESLFGKLFPVFKNYILFAGSVALLHFQGQQLALPPPV